MIEPENFLWLNSDNSSTGLDNLHTLITQPLLTKNQINQNQINYFQLKCELYFLKFGTQESSNTQKNPLL